MTTREEYAAKLEAQLERWNQDVSRWEAQARAMRFEARGQCSRHLAALQAQREHARYNLHLLRHASTTAWAGVARGADQAWERMRQAVAQARAYFDAENADLARGR